MFQLQKNMSLRAFLESCGAENRCQQKPSKQHWSEGSRCGERGYHTHCLLKPPILLHGNRAKPQTSLIACIRYSRSKLFIEAWILFAVPVIERKINESATAVLRHKGKRLRNKFAQQLSLSLQPEPLAEIVEVGNKYKISVAWLGREMLSRLVRDKQTLFHVGRPE